MHPLLVCLSSLCFGFCQLYVAAEPLCDDCRVIVIHPGKENSTGHQFSRNQRIVRVINEYKQVSWKEFQLRDRIKMRSLQLKEFSFVVKLKIDNSVRCSGALIAPKLVVTSSNCFIKDETDQLKVFLSNGKTLVVNSQENPNIFPELSFLFLKLPSDVQPAALCNKTLKVGQNVSMLMASSDLSFYGRRQAQIIPNTACKKSFEEDESVYITPDMFCVKNSQNPEKCATSPGDALLIDHQLCGLNIYGSHCRANSLNADLFINLSKLQPWLNDFLEKSESTK
ncbi:uncharacterized protein Dana_GF27318 [Drosophila ananassae]|uniref:Peptidase S1 domain-containing protein n=1 Tax=Drosophila ananassae TaxID=7217 RepID=A0A0P8Y0V1_DROAN|nr:uncharacterized protein LOC26514727 [Drosophila ananassae]KPU80394.1 uncharacterized protein Dana_GF27318 [Drosophila ananassae]